MRAAATLGSQAVFQVEDDKQAKSSDAPVTPPPRKRSNSNWEIVHVAESQLPSEAEASNSKSLPASPKDGETKSCTSSPVAAAPEKEKEKALSSAVPVQDLKAAPSPSLIFLAAFGDLFS